MDDSSPALAISFCDRVRIHSSPRTRQLGVADLVGIVHGETTPSIADVAVIGELRTDYAVFVFFEDLDKGSWFASDLIEFVDHAAGSEMRIAGRRWIRSTSGEWVESDDSGGPRQ